MRLRLIHRIGQVIFGSGVAVFLATFGLTFSLGGTADFGKVVDGRYYVGSKGPRYTEVSRPAWEAERMLGRGFPWMPVILIWVGGGLMTCGMRETPRNGESRSEGVA